MPQFDANGLPCFDQFMRQFFIWNICQWTMAPCMRLKDKAMALKFSYFVPCQISRLTNQIDGYENCRENPLSKEIILFVP